LRDAVIVFNRSRKAVNVEGPSIKPEKDL